MTNKQIFVDEILNAIEGGLSLSAEAATYFSELQKTKASSGKLSDNARNILKHMQACPERDEFKATEIGEALGVSGRSVSGSIRKLVADGYVEKVGQDPVTYKITSLGKAYQFAD